MHYLARHAAQLLNTDVVGARSLHGGDLSDVLALTLADGRDVVAKSGPAPETEADMLWRMGETGAPVPDVLAVDDTVLVLSKCPGSGALTGAGWAHLGHSLRDLHQQQNDQSMYGWPSDYAFGPVPIRNRWHRSWPDFWAENRLLPDIGHLPATLRAPVSRLAANLTALLPCQPSPSLLHGDLWRGNILENGDEIAALIDPACYFGHSEVDLAMLTLFGNPPASFWSGYDPLDTGWQTRRAIYQLWPAIVHVRLFGSGYVPLAERLLAQIGV